MRRSFLGLFLLLWACGGPDANSSRTPTADKWLSRARASYKSGDLDDASQAIDGALKAAPRDNDTRLLGARIALARLDYTQAAQLAEGLPTSEAKGVRGRALWYAGDIERAADELEDMLRDPAVKDTWAHDVARLARQGQGRHPFEIEGGLVTAVEMPQAGPALVVPCELEGERILALVATNYAELMIDSASRKEPAWVNLRFGDRMEVKDVPALTHDLSAVSRQLGAPIKALIGVNVLRHMHVTFDRRASQFVVRKSDPPAPPAASRVPVFYARGGAMLVRSSVSAKDDGNALLFVDSSQFYPLALDDAALRRSGANLASFRSEPGAPQNLKVGTIPYFHLGALDLPQIPAMEGVNIGEYRQTFDVDLGGVVGAGLLSAFRVTFAEDGRSLWLELDPALSADPGPQRPQPNDDTPPPVRPSGKPGPTPAPGPKPTAPGAKPTLTPPSISVPKLDPGSTPAPAPSAPSAPSAPKPKSDNKGAAK